MHIYIFVNACILIVSSILEKFDFELGEWPATLCGIYTTMVALNLGPNIVNYFKFNNAKKHFDSNEKKFEEDEEGGSYGC